MDLLVYKLVPLCSVKSFRIELNTFGGRERSSWALLLMHWNIDYWVSAPVSVYSISPLLKLLTDHVPNQFSNPYLYVNSGNFQIKGKKVVTKLHFICLLHRVWTGSSNQGGHWGCKTHLSFLSQISRI